MDDRANGLLIGLAALMAAAILLACTRVPPAVVQEIGDCGTGEIGILADTNQIVVGTKPGSAAEAAGVQAGDRLLTLNGVRFTDQYAAIQDILIELSPCVAMHERALTPTSDAAGQQSVAPLVLAAELVVIRDGSELSFTVDLANEPDVQYGKSGYTGPGDPWGATHTPLPPDAFYAY